MIEIYRDGSASRDFGPAYAKSGKLLGRLIMPVTSRLRCYYGKTGIDNTGSHLDIGCGDCLFLKKSPCEKRVGLDLRYDDRITDRLQFDDGSFDNVSMLAVIEHLQSPRQIIEEVHRVLRTSGRLIVTTPRQAGEWIIRLYSRDIDDEEQGHEQYFDESTMEGLTEGLFTRVTYRPFLMGLNQLFVYQKNDVVD